MSDETTNTTPAEANTSEKNSDEYDLSASSSASSLFLNSKYSHPNFAEDGSIHYAELRDPAYDFSSATGSNCFDLSSYDKGDIKDWAKKLSFNFTKYGGKNNSAERRANATQNGKMTLVLSKEQFADYKSGKMPVGMEILNPNDFSGSNENFNHSEMKKMFGHMQEATKDGGVIVQLGPAEYEKAFGFPPIRPLNYENDKLYGSAILGGSALRKGSQMFVLSEAEIQAINEGRGLTAAPIDEADVKAKMGKDIFKSNAAEFGAMCRGFEGAAGDMHVFFFTPEEIARMNGHSDTTVEVRDELAQIQETSEQRKKEETESKSFWGRLKEMTGFMTKISVDIGHKINGFFNGESGKNNENTVTEISPNPDVITPQMPENSDVVTVSELPKMPENSDTITVNEPPKNRYESTALDPALLAYAQNVSSENQMETV